MGLHGFDLAKLSDLVDTLIFMYPDLSRKEFKKQAKTIQTLIESIPDTCDNPMLSLNALAVTRDKINGNNAPDALLIGDGLLDFLNDNDLGINGPAFIHSHEWGQHLQFHKIDLLFNKLGKGSATRRTEMMADGFSLYFLTHKNSGNLDEKRVSQLNDIAFSIGDCKDDSEAHHGTPLQQECAMVFGLKLALQGGTDGNKGGDLIHPTDFCKLFDDALPDMLLLDYEVCNFDSSVFVETAESPDQSNILMDEPAFDLSIGH